MNLKTRIILCALCATVLLPLLGACSYEGNDDATSLVATGGEPLIFNIAPKQSFVAGNPNTRVAVDDGTGATSWVANDRIFVNVIYLTLGNEGNGYIKTEVYTLVYTAAATWDTYEGIVPTRDSDGNLIDLSTKTKATSTWPLNADEVEVNAGCFDGETTPEDFNGSDWTTVHPGIGSTADAMGCTAKFSRNTPVTLSMKHLGTRLTFTGLKAGTTYIMSGIKCYDLFYYYTLTSESPWTKESHEFTTDANGTYVYCSTKTGGALVLKEKATDTTVYTATILAGAGKSYHCVKGPGPINPDNTPNLLVPAPIVANNEVALFNGYSLIKRRQIQ